MVGRKLIARLAAFPDALGQDISSLSLVDVTAPTVPRAFESKTTVSVSDLSDPGVAAALIARRPDLIIHLAAVVSGEAEEDFSKGYRVNLDGGRALLDAIRDEGLKAPYKPRVVIASSIAVFGTPFPEKIGDEFLSAPLTSYGTQKAIMELLLSDYSRRGILDGIALRLPTICVRPGRPNAAASGFFSNILREPLVGQEAVLPVGEDVRHWFASPRSATGFFIHAAILDLDLVGNRRSLTMPGVSATVGDQLGALERIAGSEARKLINREPDPVIQRIVAGWPRDFEPQRALRLGFRSDRDMDEILRVHIEDELEGQAKIF